MVISRRRLQRERTALRLKGMGPAEHVSGVARSPVWLEQSNQWEEYLKRRSENRVRATSTENLLRISENCLLFICNYLRNFGIKLSDSKM